jgi:DNA-binding response OmpR family regulator
MNNSVPPEPVRPRVLLSGDAAARPAGLERALARAGFVVLEAADVVGLDDERTASLALVTLLPNGTGPREPLRRGTGTRRLLRSRWCCSSRRPIPDHAAYALAAGAADVIQPPVHLGELAARLCGAAARARTGHGDPRCDADGAAAAARPADRSASRRCSAWSPLDSAHALELGPL